MCAVSSNQIIHHYGFFYVLVTVVLDDVCCDAISGLFETHELGSKLRYDIIFGKMFPEYRFGAVLSNDHWVSL